MRFFMITRHHAGDGKYLEPIENIMTEGCWDSGVESRMRDAANIPMINIDIMWRSPCVGRCWVMSNEKLRYVMPWSCEYHNVGAPAPLTLVRSHHLWASDQHAPRITHITDTRYAVAKSLISNSSLSNELSIWFWMKYDTTKYPTIQPATYSCSFHENMLLHGPV